MPPIEDVFEDLRDGRVLEELTTQSLAPPSSRPADSTMAENAAAEDVVVAVPVESSVDETAIVASQEAAVSRKVQEADL